MSSATPPASNASEINGHGRGENSLSHFSPSVEALFAETFLSSDNQETNPLTPTLIEAILEPDNFLVSRFLRLGKKD